MKTDRKFCVQIAYHLTDMLINRDDLLDDEKQLLAVLKPYANEMHRSDVPKFEEKED